VRLLIGRNKIHSLVAITFLLLTGGCSSPDRALITRDGSHTRLVEDSPEVERLLSVQKTRDTEANEFWREKHTDEEGLKHIEDMLMRPERYAPGRKEFLAAMFNQPGISVPERTYARLLEYSGARCTPRPGYSTVYIKVRITSGPLLGQQGWICEDNVGRTQVMP
jgi:hypothetical protein